MTTELATTPGERAEARTPVSVIGLLVLLSAGASALHGETKFNRLSAWWPFYWKLLASHILLSVVALPVILITFFLSLTGRFPAHKRLARYTLPIWLYVSVTGVIVYLMQAVTR